MVQRATGDPPNDGQGATVGGVASTTHGLPANSLQTQNNTRDNHPPSADTNRTTESRTATPDRDSPTNNNPNQNMVPEEQPPTRQNRSRANILTATLNVKGRSSTRCENSNPISKWTDINRTIREKQIAILALQETHLEPTHLDTVHQLFGKRLLVHNSADPRNPSASAGVAFVLNKEKIETNNAEFMELFPGRALLLIIKRRNDKKLHILNIYAPTTQGLQQHFWLSVTTRLRKLNITTIDMLLGDFNLTEDPID